MSPRYGTRSPTARTTDATSRSPWLHRHGLLAYTLIAYLITWALLIGGFLGTTTGVLDPEGVLVSVMIQVAAAGPLIAALTVISRTLGRRGLAALGRSLIKWRVDPGWYAAVFLGVPLLMVAAVAVRHPETASALPENWSLLLMPLPLGIVGVAVVTGLAEEPGWRGYAQPTTNRRFPPLVAALVVSLIWAAWHLPNALFTQDAAETATHFLATLVNGFVLAWAYNSTQGSLLIVMLLHGSQNATNGLINRLATASGVELTTVEYYLISAITFGALISIVAVLTRGRLGTHTHHREESAEPRDNRGGRIE